MYGFHLIGLFAAVLLLFGCGGPTLYQPAAPDYGYKEQQIEENRFRVVFAGNSLTSRETVENYLLYRAAELTIAHQFDYFVVADQNLETKTRYVYSFTAFPGYGFYRLYGHRGRSLVGRRTLVDGRAWPRTRYEAVANIVLFRGASSPNDVKSFNAREVLRFLNPRIERPESVVSG